MASLPIVARRLCFGTLAISRPKLFNPIAKFDVIPKTSVDDLHRDIINKILIVSKQFQIIV